MKKFEKRNDIYYPRYVVGRKLWQKLTKNILIRATGGWNHTFRIFKRKFPYISKYYFGSQWWCLNNTMVQWMYNYLKSYPGYMNFFKHSLCPDECFFQTLVMSSPYADSVRSYLHYIKWVNGKSSPEILTQKDYKELIKSPKLMARKFDMDIDSKIIDMLYNI